MAERLNIGTSTVYRYLKNLRPPQEVKTPPEQTWEPVPAEPARKHVQELLEFGLGYRNIADLAHVRVTTIRRLILGDQKGNLPSASIARPSDESSPSSPRSRLSTPPLPHPPRPRRPPPRPGTRHPGWSFTEISRRWASAHPTSTR